MLLKGLSVAAIVGLSFVGAMKMQKANREELKDRAMNDERTTTYYSREN